MKCIKLIKNYGGDNK